MTALVVVENDEVISSKILFYIMKLPDVFFFLRIFDVLFMKFSNEYECLLPNS